jgi:hypothetical protein
MLPQSPGLEAARPLRSRCAMGDVIAVGCSLAFFAIAWAYAVACARV